MKEISNYIFARISPNSERRRSQFIRQYFGETLCGDSSETQEKTWEALKILDQELLAPDQDAFWGDKDVKDYFRDKSWGNLAGLIRRQAKKYTYTPTGWDLEPHREMRIDPCFDGENLEGTSKQINWAHKIRSEFVGSIIELHGFEETSWMDFETFSTFLQKAATKHSEFWIRNREETCKKITELILNQK